MVKNPNPPPRMQTRTDPCCHVEFQINKINNGYLLSWWNERKDKSLYFEDLGEAIHEGMARVREVALTHPFPD